MKQKIVIRMSAVDHKKGRSRALKIAASISGVESIALLGEENDQIEVIGDEVDAVGLARSLRKKFGHAKILNVSPADQKKEEEENKKKKKEEEENKKKEESANNKNESTTPLFCTCSNYPYEYYSAPYYVYNVVPSHEPYCSIM